MTRDVALRSTVASHAERLHRLIADNVESLELMDAGRERAHALTAAGRYA